MSKEAYTSTLAVPAQGEELLDRPESVEVRVLTGEVEGKVFVLRGKRRFAIGRGGGNDVVLPDLSVSTSHAELSISAAGVELADLGSSNGTRVGSVALQRGTLLGETDVCVGQCVIRVGAVRSSRVAVTRAEEFCGIVGRSAAMRELFSRVERLAPTPLSTLLLGETGTGKELFARALHERSGRRGPFVVFNCAAVPSQLAESAILGHRRGAFTGATDDRPGVFEEADGGTLFLDEIGELPLELQPKLLRVLQERVVSRVGETLGRPVDVRVVAATHRRVGEMVSVKAFRLDLYERIRAVELELPALRERREDIPLLAERFALAAGRAIGEERRLTPGAMSSLSARDWPGNVRGLKNVVERGAYLCARPPVVSASDLGLEPVVDPETTGPLVIEPSLLELPLKEAAELRDTQFRREFCVRMLQECEGNLSEAARRLGYSRKGLRALLLRLGVERSPGGS